MRVSSVSLKEIKIVASALSQVRDSFVFVGGASLPFYLPKLYQSEVRPTNDIDVVVEALTRIDATKLEKQLLKIGFQNEEGYIGRFRYQGIVVDLMSTSKEAFDCENIWYKEGFDHAVVVEKSPIIKVMSLPYFLACKFEAFRSRGNNDYQASKDMEDIVGLLDVAAQDLLENVLKNSNQKLNEYLKKQFQMLSTSEEFKDAVPGNLMNRANPKESMARLFARLKNLIKV